MQDHSGEGDMATILRFPVEARASATAAMQPGESAQILFFTGVRYERVAVAKSKAPRKQRRRRPQRRTKSA